MIFVLNDMRFGIEISLLGALVIGAVFVFVLLLCDMHYRSQQSIARIMAGQEPKSEVGYYDTL